MRCRAVSCIVEPFHYLVIWWSRGELKELSWLYTAICRLSVAFPLHPTKERRTIFLIVLCFRRAVAHYLRKFFFGGRERMLIYPVQHIKGCMTH